MAQKTFTSEMLTSADVNTYLAGEGGAWTTWTPTVTQSGSVTVTNTRSRYARYGRLIVATFSLSVTGSGTGSNQVVLSLPVTAATSGEPVGKGYILDSSVGLLYGGLTYLESTTTMTFLQSLSTGVGTLRLGAGGFTAGLASGDTIKGQMIYEAAS